MCLHCIIQIYQSIDLQTLQYFKMKLQELINEIAQPTLEVTKVVTKLPEGVFLGTLMGYTIDLKIQGESYEIAVTDGIRGSCQVVVISKDGVVKYLEINN